MTWKRTGIDLDRLPCHQQPQLGGLVTAQHDHRLVWVTIAYDVDDGVDRAVDVDRDDFIVKAALVEETNRIGVADRAVAVKLSDGSIRNAYTVRLLNKRGFDRIIAIDVDGPVNAVVHVVGADFVTPDRPMIVLGRDQTTELRLLVTAPTEGNPEKSIPVRFHVTDSASARSLPPPTIS